MKKYVLNKNVNISGGVAYTKGQEITKDMAGFEDLVKGGHCEVIVFRGEGESVNESAAPGADEAPSQPEASGSEEQAEESSSKKHGRNRR